MFQIQITSIVFLTRIDDIQAWTKTSERRPIYQERKFCLAKRKKSLDLQIYSRIGKTVNILY